MLAQQKWIIPNDMLIDGSVHCVKNAKRLSEDAKLLFESKRYSSCVSLAVLALEELGKSFMLLNACEKKQEVGSRDWPKFRSHRKKLEFLIDYLRTDSDDESHKRSLDTIANIMSALLEKKMDSLYVDWDGTRGEWHYFDEHESAKQRIVKDALKACKALIDSLPEHLGDADLMLPSEIIESLQNGKVYGFCEECGQCMFTPTDVRIHSIRTTHGRIFYYIVPKNS